MPPPATRVLCADTITTLPPGCAGAVLVAGSHGGRYPGYLAARACVRAVILNDAGIGLDEAGIGSLPYLEALGIAAATVFHDSCLIGDSRDMLAHGRISRANAAARAAGITPGMPCAAAADLLMDAPHHRVAPPTIGEARSEIATQPGQRRILLLDSASLVCPQDAGQVIVTGSHGGLIGGDPLLALKVDGWAAVFNDAARSDGPGISRLPALDARGIAAVTVASTSARIGEAASTFHDGIISAVNNIAATRAARVGQPLRQWLCTPTHPPPAAAG